MATTTVLPPVHLDAPGLDTDFAKQLTVLLNACRQAGYNFRLGDGLRSPQQQALYYCQWNQRSPADIDVAAKALAAKGAPWLAGLLTANRDATRGAWKTSALPGAGWHQWGLAADCYCFDASGKMIGNASNPAYKFYATTAQDMGLTAGYYFSHQDAGHVQMFPQADASSKYAWPYIDQTMKARWGGKASSVPTSSKLPAMP